MMKTAKWKHALLVLGAAALIGGLVGLGCRNSEYGGGGFAYTERKSACTDTVDNDADLVMDRFGWPIHCSVSIPELESDGGSTVAFYVTGTYAGVTLDTYTVTVAKGTDVAGGPTITWTTESGTDDGGPLAVGPNRPFSLGNPLLGLVVFFMKVDGDFSLVTGERWKVKVKPAATHCDLDPDPACYDPRSEQEIACQNGVDDDGDGLADADDPGCRLVCTHDSAAERYWPTWDSESDFLAPVPACNDGLDNDSDTDIDGADSGCLDALSAWDDCDLFE